VIIASAHRNTLDVVQKIRELAGKIDVIIVGAGWANALTGLVDALLRYAFRAELPIVLGVAFTDANDARHTAIAILSILDVPGTRVVCNHYVGAEGFYEACKFATEGELPKIKLPDPKPTAIMTLAEAIQAASEPR